MSKKKRFSTATILIFTTITIGLAIWGYFSIIRPIYLNNANQTKTIEIKSDTELAFGKHKDQGDVYGIEIEIKGDAASNFDLLISDGKEDKHVASVKGENFNYVYKNNWTSDSCFLKVLPHGKNGGTITVDCRFLALE